MLFMDGDFFPYSCVSQDILPSYMTAIIEYDSNQKLNLSLCSNSKFWSFQRNDGSTGHLAAHQVD